MQLELDVTNHFKSEKPKTIIKYAHSPDLTKTKYRVITEKQLKKISGHRAIALWGEDKYTNPLAIVLKFHDIDSFEGNDATAIGQYLEQPIVKTYLNHDNFINFDYKTYNGDCLNDKWFSGLIDAYDNDSFDLLEVKTWRRGLKYKEHAYFLQLMLYWYIYGMKNKVNSAYLIAYRINDDKEILEHIKNNTIPQIDPSRLTIKELPEWYKINAPKLLKKALKKYKELFFTNDNKKPHIDVEVDFGSIDDYIDSLKSKSDKFNIEFEKCDWNSLC